MAPFAHAADDFLCLTDLGQIWIAESQSGSNFAPPVHVTDTPLRYDASSNTQVVAGRFVGDARSDLIEIGPGGVLLVSERTNDGFSTPQEQSSGYDFDVLNGALVLVGDMEGDGDDDLLQIRSNGDVDLGRNEAGTFAPLVTVIRGEAFFDFSNNKWVGVGDHDGDGWADLLSVSGADGDIAWWQSTGSGFDPAIDLGPSGFRMDVNDGWGLHSADLNGDGRDDLVCVTEFGEAWAKISNGTGWSDYGRWGALGFHDAPFKGKGWTVFVTDSDDDGDDDLLCLNEFGEAWLSLSTGSALGAPTRRAALGFQHQPAGPFATFAGSWN